MKLVWFIFRRAVFSILTILLLAFLIYYTTTFFSARERAFLFISPYTIVSSGHDIPIEEIVAKYHLEDPFYIQYLNWLKLLLTEHTLGYSYLSASWVSDLILRSFPATLELVMFSAPIIVLGGIKLGAYSAKRAHKKMGREDPMDFLVRAAMALAYSVPSFFLGLLSLSIFFLMLHWFAPGRIGNDAEFFMYSGGWKNYTGLYTIDALLNRQFWIFADALKHLVLPVATLTISMLPIVAKVTRSSMLTEFGNSYVTAAKAKGLKELEVISRVRKNAMISILTVSSILFANMLTGIVVTEYVFSFGGVGSLAVSAARRYDFTLLAGLAIVFCLIFVVINLLVDIIYIHLDPRVKL